MNRKVRFIGNTLDNVGVFAQAHESAWPQDSRARTLFTLVALKSGEIKTFAASQKAGRGQQKGGTRQKEACAITLRALVKRLVNTGKQAFKNDPEVGAQFRMPPFNETALLIGAKALLPLSTQYATQLQTFDLPADFASTMQAAILAFEGATVVQDTGAQKRSGATRALDEAARVGLAAVRELDPIVVNKFADDAVVLGQWQRASKLEAEPVKAQEQARQAAQRAERKANTKKAQRARELADRRQARAQEAREIAARVEAAKARDKHTLLDGSALTLNGTNGAHALPSGS